GLPCLDLSFLLDGLRLPVLVERRLERVGVGLARGQRRRGEGPFGRGRTGRDAADEQMSVGGQFHDQSGRRAAHLGVIEFATLLLLVLVLVLALVLALVVDDHAAGAAAVVDHATATV